MFCSIAPKYTEKGLFVIPILPGHGKKPAIPWGEATFPQMPSLEVYESWHSSKRYEHCGIAIILGKRTGIIAVDIDKDDARLKEECPLSPVEKFGAKGGTRFFKYNGEKTIRRNDYGIEILSDGSYTVIPPTIHEGVKRPYVWKTREDLLSIDVDDLPYLDASYYSKILSMPSGAQEGRHNKLQSMCFAAFNKENDLDKVAQELFDYDQSSHIPPYFTDKTETHKGKGMESAKSFVKSLYRTFLSKGGQTTTIDLGSVLSSAKMPNLVKKIQKKKIEVPEPYGVLKDLTNYIYSSSVKPRRCFSLVSAISAMSTVLCNKLRLDNSTPNLYQVLITGSGGGKDKPLKTPTELLRRFGFHELCGLNEYRSDKNIILNLSEQRERIDTINEISKLYKAIKSNQHSIGIPEVLTMLWDSGNDFYGGHKGMRESVGACYNPCVGILAAGTESAFERHFSSELLEQGFGARFLYFTENERTKMIGRKDRKNVEIPKSVVDYFEYWKSIEVENEKIDAKGMGLFTVDLKNNKVEIKEVKRPTPKNVLITEEAENLLDKLMFQYDDEANLMESAMIIPLKNRQLQQIERLCITLAASAMPGERIPLVTKKEVEFAAKYTQMAFEMTSEFMMQSVSSSKFYSLAKYVHNKILEGGEQGVKRSDLTKIVSSNRGSKISELNEALIMLTESGAITCLEAQGKVKYYKAISLL